MYCWKMDGAGNDFVCINNIKEKLDIELLPELAIKLCGKEYFDTDGMMVVDVPENNEADFKMRFYNCDGTIGEMCGNGARCICRYGYENGLSGDMQNVETVAGIVTGWRISENQYKVRLNNPENVEINKKLIIDGDEYICTYLELGNPGIPHAVVEMPDLSKIKRESLYELGKKIRNHKSFYKGANVNFYEQISDGRNVIATFERGVEDFTDACGTGAGATAVALALTGKSDNDENTFKSRGGTLTVNIERNNNKICAIYLTGPADIVVKQNIEI